MTGMEVFLIIVGVVCVVGSIVFGQVLDEKFPTVNQATPVIDEEELRKKVSREVDTILDEKVENTEVRMERLMNEKIMSMGEYSEGVLSDINKNHEEVMFIYGMLGDKEKEVKKTLIEIENVKKSVKILEKEERRAASVQDGQNMPEKSNQNMAKKEDGNVLTKKEKNTEENKKKSAVALSVKQVKQRTNNNEKILEKFRKGKTAVEIAKELNIGIGEVRLVIDLYNNR